MGRSARGGPAGDGRLVRNDLGQYVTLAAEWWRPDGAFAALRWLAEARARLVPPAPHPGAVLADLGCGGGLLAPYLAGKGYRHVGVDPVRVSLAVAAEHGVTAVAGDAYRVPLADGCCDVVVAGELLEHVADPDRVIAEAARLLRPGGLLVGDTINATAVARLALVRVGERVPGLVPRGIHDPDLFCPPSRVLAAGARNGIAVEVRGLRPEVPAFLRFLATRRGPVRMVPDRNTALLYQFRGRRL
ncbi:MAG TPA: methyltransferase domain-containing protein [Actinocatenispora sp.]